MFVLTPLTLEACVASIVHKAPVEWAGSSK